MKIKNKKNNFQFSINKKRKNCRFGIREKVKIKVKIIARFGGFYKEVVGFTLRVSDCEEFVWGLTWSHSQHNVI